MNPALAVPRVALAYINDRLPKSQVTGGFAPGEEETGHAAGRHDGFSRAVAACQGTGYGSPGTLDESRAAEGLAVAAHRVEYQSMLADPGCYEERYRLTGRAALGVGVGIVSVGLGILWQVPGVSAATVILAMPVIISAIAVVLAAPGVVAAARRMTAFRADYAGITLGATPDNWTFFRRPATFVPWAEIGQITLYSAGSSVLERAGVVDRIVLHHQDAVTAAQQGAAVRTARRITGWRLDCQRLATVTAAVAPGVPIIVAGADSSLDADRPT